MILKNVPVTDDHIHIDLINGRGIEAAKDFHRSGGTHIFLVSKPAWSFGIIPKSGEDYRKVFDITLETAEKIRETGVVVYPILGVHPAELTKLNQFMTLNEAEKIMCDGLSLAAGYVREKRAVAIKSGRPHYPVEDLVLESSNRILFHALTLAGEEDCALQIHAETGPCSDVVDMAKKAGTPVFRVVKHFASPKTPLTPSMLAKHESIPDMASEKRSFTMESDYMDDNQRPGSVIGPKSVPRFTRKMLENNLISEEDAFRIHKDTPEKVYGVEINL
ncbi:hydrolase TatD [Methanoplanus sp. FWC-SCC4]|uniref:Hydrolase TatD n=1 Tax=Methanochimaera problematica TaxID=2609417 RepID=A0AA97FC35_9EURY|nr:TatD family hydrolase [Methanoplanus sp. FWC-SCC4]WOF16327.1 hydrolase TatD [Methanoplanus sp. FWC-SCC4]